jgi:hypothetical protein
MKDLEVMTTTGDERPKSGPPCEYDTTFAIEPLYFQFSYSVFRIPLPFPIFRFWGPSYLLDMKVRPTMLFEINKRSNVLKLSKRFSPPSSSLGQSGRVEAGDGHAALGSA